MIAATDRLWRSARERISRQLHPTRVLELELPSPVGRLPARLHLPEGPGPFPAVWLVPGALDGMGGVEGHSCVLTAPRLAREGFAAFCYSPSGREGAPGREDHGGQVHRAEGVAALELLLGRADLGPVSVLSISFGLTIAANALAAAPALAERVRVFVDWEGPGHRRWLQPRGGWIEAESYWDEREAVRVIGRLRCPYRRFQAAWDHVHGPRPEIGLEMARAAAEGGVDVRLNESRPPFSDVVWGPRRPSRQAEILLKWLRDAT